MTCCLRREYTFQARILEGWQSQSQKWSKALTQEAQVFDVMLRVAKSLAQPELSPVRLHLSPCLQPQGRAAWQSMPLKSQASLISSLPSYHSSELADRDALNSKTGLQSVDWLDAFRADPANEPVLTAGAMLSNNAKLPPDHIVCMCNFAAKLAPSQ